MDVVKAIKCNDGMLHTVDDVVAKNVNGMQYLPVLPVVKHKGAHYGFCTGWFDGESFWIQNDSL